MSLMDALKNTDPEIAAALDAELSRQRSKLELIASENIVSRAVMEAQGSVLTNKYAEGYPGKRYYGGCECVDVVETLAIERAKELFGAGYVNVQPHSGAQANMAVFFSLLSPGDVYMGMNLTDGGHLTHGSAVNMSGKYFHVVPYGVDKETERIDYEALEKQAKEVKPKLIVAGASAYARILDFERLSAIAKAVGAYLMVDMAHIAGLVAGGMHPNPLPWADVVTTTTHKTLRGPRGGMILAKDAEFGAQFNKAIFPAAVVQGIRRTGRQERQEACRFLAGEGLPHRLGRHGQPLDACRSPEQGRHGQGGAEPPRRRRHHGEPQHDPVRAAVPLRYERPSSRLARAYDARFQGSRHGGGRRHHRARPRPSDGCSCTERGRKARRCSLREISPLRVRRTCMTESKRTELAVHIVDHPLVQHKLTLMRQKETGTKDFRELLEEIAMLMAYEITRGLPLEDVAIETPVAACRAKKLAGKKLGIVPILRAGLGMAEGILRLVPAARVGHIGLYRDPETLQPVEYFCKLPGDVGERMFIVVDPMLATGGSSAAALDLLKEKGAKSIVLLCLVAAPEGVRTVNEAHPDIPIYVASVDERLNEHGYIVPGLGDAGDRIFGTL